MKNLFQVKPIKKTLLLGLLLALTVQLSKAQESEKTSIAHLGLFYPISTNGKNAAQYSNDFSFHLIMGLSKNEKNVAISGIANIVKQKANGVQFAGIFNHVGTKTKGLQMAGIYNNGGDSVQGVQYAGLINQAGDVDGMQMAGLVNRAGNAKGVQFAGFFNKAKNVDGMQMAGFINIAKKVKGVQFAGFINIADSSDYPIGVLNFIKNGEKSISISTDETFNLLASFRSGGRVLYGIVELGYNLKSDASMYAIGGGMGAHIRFSDKFRVNTEATTLVLDDFHRGGYSKHSLRILPALKLSDKMEVFGGPAFNFVDTDILSGKDLFNSPLWENTRSNGHFQQFYIGFLAGLQIMI